MNNTQRIALKKLRHEQNRIRRMENLKKAMSQKQWADMVQTEHILRTVEPIDIHPMATPDNFKPKLSWWKRLDKWIFPDWLNGIFGD